MALAWNRKRNSQVQKNSRRVSHEHTFLLLIVFIAFETNGSSGASPIKRSPKLTFLFKPKKIEAKTKFEQLNDETNGQNDKKA